MRHTLLFSLFTFLFLPHMVFAEKLLLIGDEKPIEVLQKYLAETAGYEVELVDQAQVPKDLSSYYAVFQYIHGTMTPETSHAIIDYTKNGGRLVLLHHGIASARWKNPEFLDFVGIHLDPRDHPMTPWRVWGNTTHIFVNLNPSHYITTHNVGYDRMVHYQPSDYPSLMREWDALVFENTEVFLNQQFTDGREKTVLFGFQCTDPETGETINQDRSGWLKRGGKGWIFYLQPGHAASDFENKNYCQIIWNCLTWIPED